MGYRRGDIHGINLAPRGLPWSAKCMLLSHGRCSVKLEPVPFRIKGVARRLAPEGSSRVRRPWIIIHPIRASIRLKQEQQDRAKPPFKMLPNRANVLVAKSLRHDTSVRKGA
jgi:hypothetical protein